MLIPSQKIPNPLTGEEMEFKLNTPVEVTWESTVRAEPEEIPGLDMKTKSLNGISDGSSKELYKCNRLVD